MAKYSLEFKLKVVEEYLAGKISYSGLCRKYNISSHRQIRKWVNDFQLKGVSSLKRSRNNQSYSVEFKLQAITMYETSESSYDEIARQLNIKQGSTIAIWRKIYHEQGISGLSKPKGRPRMTEKNQQEKPQNPQAQEVLSDSETEKRLKEAQERIKSLEHENLMLTIKNEYWEQLRSLRLQRLKKTKQESSSNSESDSN